MPVSVGLLSAHISPCCQAQAQSQHGRGSGRCDHRYKVLLRGDHDDSTAGGLGLSLGQPNIHRQLVV